MYQNHFGFRNFPFTFGSEPGDYYFSPRIRESYNGLMQGIRSGAPLLVLTGEAGVGKTALIRRIAADLDSAYQLHFCRNRYPMFADLIADFCAESNFGCCSSADPRSSLLDRLTDSLSEERKNGRRHVFIVDPIENTTPNLFLDLLAFSKGFATTDSVLQAVFLGPPAIERLIKKSRIAQSDAEHIRLYRLENLNPQETEEYIDFHLHRVGPRQEDLFSEGAVVKIANYSHGNPRIINTLCGFSLLTTFLDGKNTITLDTLDEVARNTICQKEDRPNRLARATGLFSRKTRDRQVARRTADRVGPRSDDPSASRTAKESHAALTSRRYDELGIPKPGPIRLPVQPRKWFQSKFSMDSIRLPLGKTARTLAIGLLATSFLAAVTATYHSVPPDSNESALPAMAALEAPRPRPGIESEPTVQALYVAVDSDPIPLRTARASAARPHAAFPDALGQPPSAAPVQAIAADSEASRHSNDDAYESNGNRRPDQALLKAKAQMEARRLTTPPGNNAYETYRLILSADPDNREASYGIFRIKRTYQRWGLQAEQRGDLFKAKTYYARANRIAPNDKVVSTALEHVRQKLNLEWKYGDRIVDESRY